MEEILWEVQYLSPPKTIRYCKKCGMKTEHVSSGLFRVNAQQKSLDIWLIYRCASCKATWNLTIYSRINPKRIGQTLLNQFMNNDSELAQRYAMDTELLKRSGAEIDAPSYSIIGEMIDFTKDVKLKIVSKYSEKVKVSKILREKLSLTKTGFDEMVSNGVIRLENGADIHKCKLQHDIAVLISGASIYSKNVMRSGGKENA